MVWNCKKRPLYSRHGQRYPSDLTNDEWKFLKPLLPATEGRGRPLRHSLREVINGIRYVQRYGIPWDAMPKGLPPGSICYDCWRLLTDGGHMERINHHLVMMDREKAAESIKHDAPQGERSGDAGKKFVSHKRHIAVGIKGRLLAAKITLATEKQFSALLSNGLNELSKGNYDGATPLFEKITMIMAKSEYHKSI